MIRVNLFQMVLALNTDNQRKVSEIMQLQQDTFDMIVHLTHVKFSNNRFDIVAKNNTNIVVMDKHAGVVYKDLRTAYNQLFNT